MTEALPTPQQENEYTRMERSFQQAKLAAFLIVPLKWNEKEAGQGWLDRNAEERPLTTPDLNDSVKQLMNSRGHGRVLRRYQLSREKTAAFLPGEVPGQEAVFYAAENTGEEPASEESGRFVLHGLEFYLFHTEVAFVCVKISFGSMSVLDTVANMGYAENRVLYYRETASGGREPFDFEGKLRALCREAGLSLFYPNGSSVFLEAYSYAMAVVPERFRELATMRQATFNMHLMVDLPQAVEDSSEQDVNYVYAVKDQGAGSYRWGSCITSQTISYVVARADLDLEAEMREQSENGLPVVLLALYQKYTCLSYQSVLAGHERLRRRELKELKRRLLEFQAYGTIAPANISRWHNIKQTYKYLMEENDVSDAVDKMSFSLNILADRQKEAEEARADAVLGLISIFGVVSIPSSVISILDVMNGGNPVNRLATVVSLLSITLMIIVLLMYKRGDRS